ncbi:MAG: hypothetical protein A2W00_06175, partial [Candidatus Eisenbacteria bacterium RBG_16_71_46]
MPRPRTLEQLKASGYRPRSVKDEMRANLIARLRSGEKLFPGIVGYENTVEPQIVNAVLSRHDFILLGLRGQAKTRLLRSLVQFLDEWIPAIEGCPLNSDPYQPLTHHAKTAVEERGNDTPITWIPREQRYQEKLATPDVTIADLIGDIDPIKAATLRLDYSDERVIHYGIVPRTNRGIFAINELPDLQPRIQVGLLNILEEKDFQIRGFPVRMPLDVVMVFSANPEDYTNRGNIAINELPDLQPRIQVGLLNILEEKDFQIRGFPVRMPLDVVMVFSANPEDYTNRGNIITPLRDRINSQIITHYPQRREDGMAITAQESWIAREGSVEVRVPAFMRELVEEVAIQARRSEYVDQNSGVSARLPIALIENLVSNAERRALTTGETTVTTRVCDLQSAVSAVSGKVELVLEGEQEGALNVARALLGRGIKSLFSQRFPDAYKPKRTRAAAAAAAAEGETLATSEYRPVLEWFASGSHIEISDDIPQAEYVRRLSAVKGLGTLAAKYLKPADPEEAAVAMELVLEGLHQHSMLSRERTDGATTA